jgi:hypothetical protein
LDEAICDAVLYPRCPLIFGDEIKVHDERLKIFLVDHNIPIRVVVSKANRDTTVAFVYLTDEGNIFSSKLVENMNNSLIALAK